MSHKIKALILAAFATLALSAVGVGLAQAEEDVSAVLKGGHTDNGKGEQERTNTVLTGTQEGTSEDNFFDAGGNRITCTNDGVNFAGTVADTGDPEYLTVTAEYDKCETFEGQAVTVDMNGCDYTFESPDTTTAEGQFTGEATLYCGENEQVEISVYLFRSKPHKSHSFKVCTIKVGNAEGTHTDLSGHIVYENKTNPDTETDDITAWATVGGIPYSGCGSEGESTYESTVTLEGYKDAEGENEHEHTDEPLDLWLEH